MDRSKLYSIHRFAEICNVSAQTLRNWDKNGKLKPFSTNKGGYRYYSQEQLNYVLSLKGVEISKKIIGYCRVSTNSQKDDLEKQINNIKSYMYAKGYSFEIITDIGSGINYTKKGLEELISKICNKEISKIVILYKDRLVGFGFELIEYLCEINNVKIEIIDNSEKSKEEELTDDLIQIITIFANRLYGQHSSKTKKLIEEVKANAKSD